MAQMHCKNVMIKCNPPASKASREVANLTERKNQNAPVYGDKKFVCLSVTKFGPITGGSCVISVIFY